MRLSLFQNRGLTRRSTGAPKSVALGFPSRCAHRRPVNGIPFGVKDRHYASAPERPLQPNALTGHKPRASASGLVRA